MSELELDRDTASKLAGEIKRFLDSELDVEIGNMDAEALIGFLTPTLGARFYNMGLKDAQALFARRADDIADDIYALMKPVDTR